MAKRKASVVFAELTDLQQQKKDLDTAIAATRAELESLVPADKTVDGVFHRTRAHKSISWSKAADVIVLKLVPKTRHAEATRIIKEHTKESLTHIYEAAK